MKLGDLIRFYNYDYDNVPGWEVGIVIEITNDLPEENWNPVALPAAVVMSDRRVIPIMIPKTSETYGVWVEMLS